MAHGSMSVPYRWDVCTIPLGTGAGLTEEGVCYWLTRLKQALRRHAPHEVTASKWDN
jgi:hypothetical protein